MKQQTQPGQRQEFYRSHQAGESYEQIAEQVGVSKECVRYWCRRQRDGGDSHNRYQRQSPGLLSEFEPLVRYVILRLKLAHPRWGRHTIHHHLKKRPSLQRVKLPKPAAIGRYLYQWPRFRRPAKKQPAQRPRPQPPTQVHQQWQIDFKIDLELADGTPLILYTVRDPVGEACIGAFLVEVQRVKHKPQRVTLEQVRTVLRHCFGQWGTLPDEIQTDGEPSLVAIGQDAFPSQFSLWLVGLGIHHRVTRSGQPTDNAEVERCHRTICDYALVGQQKQSLKQLQQQLQQAVTELVFELPSWAEGCQGKPPIEAHPELLQPRHPFAPEHELALFDLRRVDAYLASFTWSRQVGKSGQITLGGHHQAYSVGRAYAGRQVLVRFDPTDRHFVFFDPAHPDQALGRRPARDLELAVLTGLAVWPEALLPQQLPLPFFEGVSF